ncbi:MAG: nuclear transport factor 2 family protein [Pseudomonadota bacterium]
MTQQANIDMVRQFVREVLNTNDRSRIADFVTPDFVRHDAVRVENGTVDVERFLQERHETYTELEWRIDQIVAHGDYVAAAMSGRGLHAGTGREVTGKGVALMQIRDGKIASSSTEWDRSNFVEAV